MDLAVKLLVDAVAAGVTALGVAPLIAAFDEVAPRTNTSPFQSSYAVVRLIPAPNLLRLLFMHTALTPAISPRHRAQAITKSASGESLWGALGRRIGSIVLKPVEFFSSVAFVWMWIVYSATYVATNSLKTIEAETGIQLGFAATFMVAVVNMSCGIAKDAAYAKMFGSKDAKDEGKSSGTPTPAFIIWFLRDLLAFTFILTRTLR